MNRDSQKGLKPEHGEGRAFSDAMPVMPHHKDAGDASANLVGNSGKQMGYLKVALQMRIPFGEKAGKPSWGLWLFNTNAWMLYA